MLLISRSVGVVPTIGYFCSLIYQICDDLIIEPAAGHRGPKVAAAAALVHPLLNIHSPALYFDF